MKCVRVTKFYEKNKITGCHQLWNHKSHSTRLNAICNVSTKPFLEMRLFLQVEKFHKQLKCIDFPFLPINECEISYKPSLRVYVHIHYGENSKIDVIYRNYLHFKRYKKYVGTNLCSVESNLILKYIQKLNLCFFMTTFNSIFYLEHIVKLNFTNKK